MYDKSVEKIEHNVMNLVGNVCTQHKCGEPRAEASQMWRPRAWSDETAAARACQMIRGAPIETSHPDVVCVNLNKFS